MRRFVLIPPLLLTLALIPACGDGNDGGRNSSGGANSEGVDGNGTDGNGTDGNGTDGQAKPGTPVEVEGEIPTSPEVSCPGRLEPLAAFGEVITVGAGTPDSCTDAELRAAVATLEGVGGTVLFDCGDASHTIVLEDELTMHNARILFDGEGRIALSGDNASRVFHTTGKENYLMLQRIEIRDGTAVEYGGGIFSEWRGKLTAIEVRFENNHTTGMIGEKGGGAVRLEGPSDTVFSDCTFVGNTSANGGGVMSTAGNVEYVGCVFKANQALAVLPETNEENLAYGNGAAIRLDGMNKQERDDLRICGTIFEDNFSKGSSGAINAFFYKVDGVYVSTHIDSSVFRNNTGVGVGAYIHMNGELHMKDSAFIGSKGESNAALFLATSERVTIDNCTFADNQANAWGSVRVRDGETEISNSTFVGNTSNYVTVFAEDDAKLVTLSNNVFLDNFHEQDKQPRVCKTALQDGGNNIQWPATRPNGEADEPCTATVVFEDPGLGELTTSGSGIPYYPRLAGGKAEELSAGAHF